MMNPHRHAQGCDWGVEGREMNKDTLAQTYVRHGDQWWFVSTINRKSSALAYPGRYAETLVWEIDPKTNERGHIVLQDEAAENSIRIHQKIIEQLYNEGIKEKGE